MRLSSVFSLLIATALFSCGSGDSGAPSASAKASTAASSTSPKTSASPPPATSSASPAPSGSARFACGSKEDPCPMQKWMKENIGKAKKAGEKDQVAAHFKTISEHAPPGYDQWKSIAEEGIKASSDLDKAGDVCKKCHDLYQTPYRNDLRDKPWP